MVGGLCSRLAVACVSDSFYAISGIIGKPVFTAGEDRCSFVAASWMRSAHPAAMSINGCDCSMRSQCISESAYRAREIRKHVGDLPSFHDISNETIRELRARTCYAVS